MEPASDRPDPGHHQPRSGERTMSTHPSEAVSGRDESETTRVVDVGGGFHVSLVTTSWGARVLHVFNRGAHIGSTIVEVGGGRFWFSYSSDTPDEDRRRAEST